jgi:glyoxylase-like metal-dependent hydrolase (beta-lactamase superfamily II)
VNASLEDVRAMAAENRLPFPTYEQHFVPTVVDTGTHLVVFDPGFGERAPTPELGRFNALLREAGHDPGDVDFVVITHSHPDHVANLANRAGEPTFPHAQVVFGRVDFDYWRRGEGIPDFRPSTLALFREVCLPLAARARFVEAGESIVPGITAVEAFGHSAGHMAYHLESGGSQLMLLGDAVAHFAASLQHPDWHFAMDDDKPGAAASRRRLLGMIAGGDMMAMGFHMPFPAIGRLERFRDGFRWLPAGGAV